MKELEDRLKIVNQELAGTADAAWRAWTLKNSGIQDIGERELAKKNLATLESHITDLEQEKELLHRALRYERIAESGDFWFLKGIKEPKSSKDRVAIDTELAVATALKEDHEALEATKDADETQEPKSPPKPRTRRARATKAQ